MIEITLLDGKKLSFNNPVTGFDIAKHISTSLAKSAYAIYVNNELWDLSRLINENCKIEILTNKNKSELLVLLRHDTAHIMAQAVQELYPNTKLGVGPSTENGFFYDFLTEVPFKEEDLAKIENRMLDIINRGLEFKREVLTRDDFISKLKNSNEVVKLEILEKISDETLTLYSQGSFSDLCRGPHSPSTKHIPVAFKLTKVSAVEWKSKAGIRSLQRIYGVSFLNEKDLTAYLDLQTSLMAHDHRKLGKDMELFHTSEEATGSVYWHHNGWLIYKTLENYIRDKIIPKGYLEVKTPQVVDKSLWVTSGHWEKYAEHMFTIADVEKENSYFALKPMNCPLHIEIFKQNLKSYKDLPMRLSEFGSCHRNEPSGALHGIMRVRAFTQDDAHIFCTDEQIEEETKQFCFLLFDVYKGIFGEIDIIVKFSDRPEQRAGTDEVWDKAENSLLNAAKSAGLDPIVSKGEGAFYGPKLEFAIKDSMGRDWQLGTLQVDYILPERLGASYIGQDGNKHTPVMLHRAILGSFERFIGILLEHYKGKLPLWLSPVQVVVATISNKADDYANIVMEKLKAVGIKAILDTRAKKINYKIREHMLKKVPLVFIVGEVEQAQNTINIRFLGEEKQIDMTVEDVLLFVQKNITDKNTEIKHY